MEYVDGYGVMHREIVEHDKTIVNILGTEYEIIKQSEKENKMLKDCSGYCDWTSNKLYIKDYEIDSEGFEYEKANLHMDCTIRHEIIHAFFHESGLWSNSSDIDGPWAMNEEMVDWLAIQSPKLFKIYHELNILN